MQELEKVPMSKMELAQHIFDTLEPGYVLRRDVRSVTEHLTDFVWSFVETGRMAKITTRPCQANEIIDLICEYHRLTMEQLTAKCRKREWVIARQEAMTILKKRTKLSLKAIGEMFGGRDHTTVIHSISTLKDLMETDEQISAEVTYLYSKLRDETADAPDENLIPFEESPVRNDVLSVIFPGGNNAHHVVQSYI